MPPQYISPKRITLAATRSQRSIPSRLLNRLIHRLNQQRPNAQQPRQIPSSERPRSPQSLRHQSTIWHQGKEHSTTSSRPEFAPIKSTDADSFGCIQAPNRHHTDAGVNRAILQALERLAAELKALRHERRDRAG